MVHLLEGQVDGLEVMYFGDYDWHGLVFVLVRLVIAGSIEIQVDL